MPAIEGLQPVSRPRLVALLISRLDLAARRRARRVYEARDLSAYFTLQRTATGRGLAGAGHYRAMPVELLNAGVGQPPLSRFRPIERDPKIRAACPAVLTDAHIDRRAKL